MFAWKKNGEICTGKDYNYRKQTICENMNEKQVQNKKQNLKPEVLSGVNTWREGKGFSERELKEAGIWESKKELPYDPRRKTEHEKNVEKLGKLTEQTEAKKTELLEEMTVKQLKDMAREKDLSGYSKMKKDEIVDLISQNLTEKEIQEYED